MQISLYDGRAHQDDAAKGKYTKDYIDEMDYSCSCLVFYWAVEGEHKDLKDHTFIISEDLDKNLEEIFSGDLIEQPSVYLSVPSNMDRSMAPEGKSSFYLLIPVSELGVAKYPYDKNTIDYYRNAAFAHLKHLRRTPRSRQTNQRRTNFHTRRFQGKFSAYRELLLVYSPLYVKAITGVPK